MKPAPNRNDLVAAVARLLTGVRQVIATRLEHRGHHERPLSDDELVTKWRILNPEADPPLHLLDPAGRLAIP